VTKIVLAPTTVPRVAPLEYIAAAAAAGYDGVGLRLYAASRSMPFTPIVGNQALMRDVKQAVADTGLAVHDVLSCYLRPETDFDGILPALEYAADLAAKYAIVICDESEWGRAVDNLGRLADLAAGYSLAVAVEGPIYSRLINTLPLVVKLVQDATRANIVICIDTYQLFRAGAGAESLVDVDAALLPYVQPTDGLASPVGFVVPGPRIRTPGRSARCVTRGADYRT
jgi:sugar phosphate isomerase/epimerase